MNIGQLVKELTSHVRQPVSEKKPSAWERSARLAATIVAPGPDVSRLKAQEVVDVLRAQAVIAEEHIREVSGLEQSPTHRARYGDKIAEVRVVDRAHWALKAAESMADLFGVDAAEPVEGVPDPTDLNGTVETTAALTYMAHKTLGQFVPNLARVSKPADLSDLASGPAADGATGELLAASNNEGEVLREGTGEYPGYLLLVAPNVLLHQRAMAVNLEQFALWICMHEFTHAMQFAAADWLPQYMQDVLDDIVRSFDSESSLIEWARAVAESLRGRDSVVDRLLNPRQREDLNKITALMSVLEGHADVIMDEVPTSVLPSKRTLRRKFNARRKETNKSSATIARMSGFSAKANQYTEGARFVREGRTKLGADGFNRVFIGPQFLPLREELVDVDAWIVRTNALLESVATAHDAAELSSGSTDSNEEGLLA